MIKLICTSISIVLLAISAPSFAQSYTIKSVEGVPVKVKLARGKSWRQLSVSITTDSVILNDCDQIKAVHVLKGGFLEIAYLGRGGTGFTGGSIMILSVSKHKLNVALVVDAFASSFAPKMDEIPYNERYYKATFTLTGTNESNYKMLVKVTERSTSTPRSRNDYNRHSQPVLNFDPAQNVFYNIRKPIDHVFMLGDAGKIHLKGLLPMIVLAGETYYYFKGTWYKQGLSDDLFTEY